MEITHYKPESFSRRLGETTSPGNSASLRHPLAITTLRPPPKSAGDLSEEESWIQQNMTLEVPINLYPGFESTEYFKIPLVIGTEVIKFARGYFVAGLSSVCAISGLPNFLSQVDQNLKQYILPNVAQEGLQNVSLKSFDLTLYNVLRSTLRALLSESVKVAAKFKENDSLIHMIDKLRKIAVYPRSLHLEELRENYSVEIFPSRLRSEFVSDYVERIADNLRIYLGITRDHDDACFINTLVYHLRRGHCVDYKQRLETVNDQYMQAISGFTTVGKVLDFFDNSNKLSLPAERFEIYNRDVLPECSGKYYDVEYNTPIPGSFSQAMSVDESTMWKRAIINRLEKLKEGGVYELITRPKNQIVLPTQWVFTASVPQNRFSASLRANGKNYVESVDDKQLPPVDNTNLREVLLALAVSVKCQWDISRLVIDDAYNYADLNDPVYVELPPGAYGNKNQVWKISKALEGINPAPKLWFKVLKSYLAHLGFQQVNNCRGLFYRGASRGQAMVLTYGSDLLVCARTPVISEQIRAEFEERFALSYAGKALEYLNLTLEHVSDGLLVYDYKNLNELLREFSNEIDRKGGLPLQPILMDDIEDATLIENIYDEYYYNGISKSKFLRNVPRRLTNVANILNQQLADRYRHGVGCLSALASRSRPDISFAVSQLSQVTNVPKRIHYNMMLWCIGYLENNREHVPLKLNNGNSLQIVACSLGQTDEYLRHPQIGYVWEIGCSLVSWCSQRYRGAARKYEKIRKAAAEECRNEGLWIRNTLYAMEFVSKKAKTKVYDECNEECSQNNSHPRLTGTW